ncbi:MAG: YciI family protein [Sporichthyaceae bacterium]|nr:YciI family protein [Sporichthyaceae bacterium]
MGMRYAMLIGGNPESWSDSSAAERAAAMTATYAWFERWSQAGKIADGGAELAEPGTARTIRGGLVIDGPFLESKEVIGGFVLLDANSMDEAVEIAATWPNARRPDVVIEVRPVVEH